MKGTTQKTEISVEQALKNSELRYRRLFESAQDGILILNAETGMVDDVNPYLIKMLGYSRKEFIKKKLWEVGAFQDVEASRDAFEALQKNEYIRYEDLPLQTKAGRLVHVEFFSNVYLVGEEKVIQCNIRNITERKHADQKIKHRYKELELLYQSGITFSQAFDQNEIGEKVIEVLSSYLNWHHAAVRVKDVDSEKVHLIAYMLPNEEQSGVSRMQAAVTHVGEGLAGWVIQNKKPLRINNLTKNKRYISTFDGMNSGLYVPIQTHNQTIGSISVESDQQNAFTKEDERLLTTLASQVAVAIENARLFKELQTELSWRQHAEQKDRLQLGRLAALNEIDRKIMSSFDLHFNIETLLIHAIAQLDVDAADVLLFNRDKQVLEFFKGSGFRTRSVQGARVPLGESYAGGAALNLRLVHIPDLSNEPDNVLLTSLLKGEDFVCYYGVPLIAKGQVYGVLEIFHRTVLKPDAEWLDFLNMLAGQTAIAIENVTLFDDLQRSNAELRLAYETTLEGWSHALDLRDKETEGHTQRVTEMAVNLARELGMNADELADLRRGALLHDIGKMGVPDHILLKPGKLTADEWKQMRMHPVYAYELLSPITYLHNALDIPRYHHEKWDSSGYPDGLKGEQIPLAARIFAVVDVWDALTSDRPYRPAWTKEKAHKHIYTSSGTHFDPQVVDKFLQIRETISKT